MELPLAALAALALVFSQVAAQSVDLSATSDVTFLEGTGAAQITAQTGPPTGPYSSYASKITLLRSSDTDPEWLTSTLTSLYPTVATGTITTVTHLTETETGTVAENGGETSTAPANPTKAQPCNEYIELCKRKYSNITMVGAHNSPFARPGNAGSNQELPVRTQLDDGIRFIQAQIRWPTNGLVPHFCHTSCDLLDAGPITEWLTEVRKWVDEHPYDVVTILLGNGNRSHADLYVPYIQQTGILKYAYHAPYLPMTLDDWPTLGEMITIGKRVVMFLDYISDQKKYPWLLDEFSQMWETPFDPLDRDFPCTVQRPPNLTETSAENRLYLHNHNLNVEFDIFGTKIHVPAVALLNETNAVSGYGSLGLAANNCRSEWGRPPNILNVDYYNYGSFCGSVFEVAAQINNVTYDRNSSCSPTSPAPRLAQASLWVTLLVALWSAYLII
ncbi:PLC-like phosphodiesterase [Ilyonectria destructans]|nr:PLC-like phosphodiesterase [Ilyonectria destructans]